MKIVILTILFMEAYVNDNKEIVYYDFSYYKKLNKDGSLVTLTNSDALSQAIKIWLGCKPNEKIRSSGGGILYQFLGKIMDDEQANRMREIIISGLKEDFNPPLTPVLVDVKGDYENERWIISLVAYNVDLQIGVNTKVIITNVI